MFYRVVPGDSLPSVARLFAVTAHDLCRWNAIDPTAHLQDGMTLQLFAETKIPLRASALVLEERDAHVLEVGTPEFFAHFEAQRGRTLSRSRLGKGIRGAPSPIVTILSVAQLERINGRARTTPISAGDKLVVYVPTSKAESTAHSAGGPGRVESSSSPTDVAVARPAVADARLAGDEVGRALMSSTGGASPQRASESTGLAPAAHQSPPWVPKAN